MAKEGEKVEIGAGEEQKKRKRDAEEHVGKENGWLVQEEEEECSFSKW